MYFARLKLNPTIHIMRLVSHSATVSLFLGFLLALGPLRGASAPDPGDTLWVQTFTWEAQDNPATAYDSPGRRWFQFPTWEDTTYRKILM
ncbi:MAG: hypothetical protein RLZZ314_312, partial [Bacteroidota bacterium]